MKKGICDKIFSSSKVSIDDRRAELRRYKELTDSALYCMKKSDKSNI